MLTAEIPRNPATYEAEVTARDKAKASNKAKRDALLAALKAQPDIREWVDSQTILEQSGVHSAAKIAAKWPRYFEVLYMTDSNTGTHTRRNYVRLHKDLRR